MCPDCLLLSERNIRGRRRESGPDASLRAGGALNKDWTDLRRLFRHGAADKRIALHAEAAAGKEFDPTVGAEGGKRRKKDGLNMIDTPTIY